MCACLPCRVGVCVLNSRFTNSSIPDVEPRGSNAYRQKISPIGQRHHWKEKKFSKTKVKGDIRDESWIGRGYQIVKDEGERYVKASKLRNIEEWNWTLVKSLHFFFLVRKEKRDNYIQVSCLNNSSLFSHHQKKKKKILLSLRVCVRMWDSNHIYKYYKK